MEANENTDNTVSDTAGQNVEDAIASGFVKYLMKMWRVCEEKEQKESESIEDITAEMRGNEFDSPVAKDWANRIEVAQKAYNKEVTELLKGVIEGVCQHCDMRDACAEGEDGMSTTCNAVAKAKHFIEQHSEPELNDDDCPF